MSIFDVCSQKIWHPVSNINAWRQIFDAVRRIFDWPQQNLTPQAKFWRHKCVPPISIYPFQKAVWTLESGAAKLQHFHAILNWRVQLFRHKSSSFHNPIWGFFSANSCKARLPFISCSNAHTFCQKKKALSGCRGLVVHSIMNIGQFLYWD